MRAHVIEDGEIVNTIEVEHIDTLSGLQLVDADLVGGTIGDQYHAETGIVTPAHAAPTEAQIVAAYEAALDAHIDAMARSLGYLSILSAISYAEEPAVPRFQLEGQALRAWRSLCYAKGHEVLAAVKAGDRPAPTHAELLSELPELVLPAA